MKLYILLCLLIITTTLFASCSDYGPNGSMPIFTVETTASKTLGDFTDNIIISEYEIQESLVNEFISFGARFILKNTPVNEEWLNYEKISKVVVSKKYDDTLNIIIDSKLIYNPIVTYITSRGYFVGYDGGEFIGGLLFISRLGEFQWLSEQNIFGFFELEKDKDTVYYFHGNSHLVTSGYLNRVIREDGKWKIDDEFHLVVSEYKLVSDNDDVNLSPEVRYRKIGGNLPQDFIVENDIVYVSTGSKLIMIEDNHVTVLLENDYWVINSLICIDGKLFFGMNGGFGSYNLDDSEFIWYEQVQEDN